jgi:hypothetical protein
MSGAEASSGGVGDYRHGRRGLCSGVFGPVDGPWVVAGPGAVVTVSDLGSTSYGAELVGYR